MVKTLWVFLSTEGSLVNKRDLLALYLSGTYCHQTDTRPPSYVTPRQPTIYIYMSPDSYEISLVFGCVWQSVISIQIPTVFTCIVNLFTRSQQDRLIMSRWNVLLTRFLPIIMMAKMLIWDKFNWHFQTCNF